MAVLIRFRGRVVTLEGVVDVPPNERSDVKVRATSDCAARGDQVPPRTVATEASGAVPRTVRPCRSFGSRQGALHALGDVASSAPGGYPQLWLIITVPDSTIHAGFGAWSRGLCPRLTTVSQPV
jgi:hypothetical protein